MSGRGHPGLVNGGQAINEFGAFGLRNKQVRNYNGFGACFFQKAGESQFEGKGNDHHLIP